MNRFALCHDKAKLHNNQKQQLKTPPKEYLHQKLPNKYSKISTIPTKKPNKQYQKKSTTTKIQKKKNTKKNTKNTKKTRKPWDLPRKPAGFSMDPRPLRAFPEEQADKARVGRQSGRVFFFFFDLCGFHGFL